MTRTPEPPTPEPRAAATQAAETRAAETREAGTRAAETPAAETPTQTLHRLTSYEPGRHWTHPVDDPRVLRDLRVNDIARYPWPCKRYADGLPRVPLPRSLPSTSAPALGVLAGTAPVPAGALDLAQLSRLLYWSAGVVRISETPLRTVLFRAAGSAGGRFPLELYVAVPSDEPPSSDKPPSSSQPLPSSQPPPSGEPPSSGEPLPAGVHWYDPVGHALVRVGPPPSGGGPAVIVTGVPWRTGWRYAERGYRHIYWDAGTLLAQLLALAGSAGLPAELYTRFPDAAVAALTGADGVHEFGVAVVGVGGQPPALRPGGPAAAGGNDRAPTEFPLVTTAQRAGDTERMGSAWASPPPLADSEPPTSPPVETVIASRGSQRRMDASRGVPADVLRVGMAVALRGVSVPPGAPVRPGASPEPGASVKHSAPVRHWVAVHDVTGLAPGVYRWPDLSAPVRRGPLREELCRVCLGQSLARDAAFVAISATNVRGLDDRQYREAQLAAGLAEGRLHLAAYALGASATGMTFIDSEVPALLGEPADALLFTCVGVPAYKSAPAAGVPGAPVPVRPVAPRS